MTTTTQKKTRAPANKDTPLTAEEKSNARIEAIRAKRKERGVLNDTGLNQKLSVPESRKDPNWEYRWVNDKAMGLHNAKARDWDFVEDEIVADDGRNSGVGTRIERVVNERTTPTPEKAFLMRKPKEFYNEDQEAKQGQVREIEDGLKRGDAGSPEGLTGAESYVPAGGISIKRGT